jgi:anti-anti-sigma regulatory factor
MLRITIHENPESLTFQLEGRLAGAWVRELEDCWKHAQASQRRPAIRFDLRGVTFVDAAGKVFLAARHAEGMELVATGCLMRAVVAEIANFSSPESES